MFNNSRCSLGRCTRVVNGMAYFTLSGSIYLNLLNSLFESEPLDEYANLKLGKKLRYRFSASTAFLMTVTLA